MKVRLLNNYLCKDIPVGTILEVIPGMNVDSEGIFNIPGGMCYLCKKQDGGLKYILAQNVEIVDASNIDWEHVRIQAAIAALQGLASNPHDKYVDASMETLAQWSIGASDALIEELKKK